MPALTGKAFPLNSGFVGIVDSDQILDVATTSGNILVSDGTIFDSVAPSSLGLAANSFTTIDCPSGTDPVADSATDTLTLSAGNGISVTGSSAADSVTFALTTLTSDWLASTAAVGINFRSTLQKIYSSAASTLDLDGENRINFRINGVVMASVETGAIKLEDSNALTWGAGTVYLIGDSFSNTLDINAATITYGSATTVTFNSADLSLIDTISMSGQLTSTLATGTAPFVVASTTLVTNLNADLLDGLSSAAFAQLAFTTIACTSGTNPVADSVTDTLNLSAGTGMTVTGDSATDTVTIATTITQYTNALAQAAAGWQDDGTVVRLVGTTDEVVIGGTAALSSAKVSIDGDSNQIQLLIQGDASQAVELFVTETSAGTDLFTIDSSGNGLWNTTLEARFRAATNRVYSRAANTLTMEGNTMTEVGKDGDIRLGVSTTRDMYPTTNAAINLGKSTNTFNDCYFGQITITDAKNIVLNTTTGTKIGTATTQKLGFWNATPVVRPSAYTPTNVTTDRSYDANSTTIDELADVLGTVIADLQSIGIFG